MKKTILAVSAMMILTGAMAQKKGAIPAAIAKGSMTIGTGLGGITFGDNKSSTSYSNTPTVYESDGNSFSISVYPSAGWFVKDRLAIGLNTSLSFYSSKSTSSNTSSTTTTESKYTQPSVYIGPFVRYYFGGTEKGSLFAQASAEVGINGGKSSSKTSTGSSSETKTKPKGNYYFTGAFGYEHFISNNVGLFGSLGVGYTSNKTSYEYRPSTGTGYDYTSKYSNLSIPVSVGFRLYLQRKKQ
jgi:hypothetical protein